jgi:hypothetical protein
MKAFKYIYTVAALMGPTAAFAQEKKIDTVEFNVISKYRPVITDAVKLNNNPGIADTIKPKRKADYNNLIYSQFPTTYTPYALQAMRMKGEPLDKLYHSYLMAGVGNYNTVYGEYFFNCLRSRDYDYGIHLNHLSSSATLKNYGYSGYAYNDINLFGDAYLRRHILSAQFDFDNHIVHDYGYDINRAVLNSNDVTLESYNNFGGAIDFKSDLKDSTSLHHDIKVSGYNFSDSYKAIENNVNGDVHVYTYYQRQRIDIDAFAHYYHDRSNRDTLNQWNLLFNPYFTEAQRHWDARLGIKVFYDPIASKFNFYPDFIGRYHIGHDAAIIYAGIDGKREINSYKTLAGMNPFISDTLTFHATNTQYHLFAGFSGTITPNLFYDINGSQSEIENMPLFVTDTIETLRNRFSVIYDKVRVINGHAELTYTMKENLSFTLSGEYNQYTPTNQLKVWYHPDLIISLTGQYIYKKNFTFKAMFSYIGTQYAPISSPTIDDGLAVKNVDAYPDLNLGFDYRYNRLLTAFININNIANVTKQRWLNYPTQGFNVLAGIRFAF